MASSSCSHWWHAPIYFAMSITLAAIAISSASINPNPNPNPISNHQQQQQLSSNASLALRAHGFSVMATLLQISPHLLSSPTTIFAVHDSAIPTATTTIKHLLHSHTSPSFLPLQTLLSHPPGTCLPTLLPNLTLSLTRSDPILKSVQINHIPISHPDLFLQPPLSIHGILLPWNTSSSPPCNNPNNRTQLWRRIVRILSSKGFVSFAIGLNSVLDGVMRDYPDLGSVTVFAPMDLVFVSSPSPLLDRIVRFHVVPRRIDFGELGLISEGSRLKTLAADRDVVVTRGGGGGGVVAVNWEEIAAGDVFSSDEFVVHGISRAFHLDYS